VFIIPTPQHNTRGFSNYFLGVYPNSNAFLTKYTICPETDRDSAIACALTCSYKSIGKRRVTNLNKRFAISVPLQVV
jgi:hypothetical protein